MAKRSKSGLSFIKKGREAVDHASEGNGSVWLKLSDGDSHEIVAIGGVEEMISFDQHAFWLDEGNSPIFPCLQTKDCPGCKLEQEIKQGGARFKAVLPVLVKTDGGQEERLVIFGKAVAKQLADAEDAVGESLHGHILRLSRKGSGINTKYTVMPTGRKAKSIPTIEEFGLDPMENIGPTTPKAIIEALAEAGLWRSEYDNPKRPSRHAETESSEDWDEDEFVDAEDEE